MSEIFIKNNHTTFKDALLKEVDGLEALSKALSNQKKSSIICTITLTIITFLEAVI